MTTEELYQDDVEGLDDYADEASAHDAQRWDEREHDEPHGYPADESASVQASREASPEAHPQASPEAHFAHPAQAESSALQSLALDLTLRCGELRLTLAELRRLDAGTVLEVSGIAPGYATLCHGERVVAEGELVDVEGRLGLQITRLAAQP